MRFNFIALIGWAWGILGDAIEGFGHGAIIGLGVGTTVPDAQNHNLIINSILAGGIVGAVKQATIYIGTNRLPPLLIPVP